MVGGFRGGGKHNQIILHGKKTSNKKREKKAEFQIPRERYLFAFPVTKDQTASFSGRKGLLRLTAWGSSHFGLEGSVTGV